MVNLRCTVLVLISSVAAHEQPFGIEHMDMHTSGDAMSLLQYQARMNKHQTVEELGEAWSGGYMLCREQPPRTQSGCKVTGGGRNFAVHPRICAEQAKVTGADSYSFLAKGDETWCLLRQCNSVDMKWEASADDWQIFSTYCGLENSRVEIDGGCRTAFTNNLIFPLPRRSICRNGLKFKTISNNNLRGFGPNFEDEGNMRITETLPGVDLVIKADANYQPLRPEKNGLVLEKMARINMKSGSNANFNFRFVRSGTDEAVRVNEFIFTVFDIDQFKGCYGQMKVNASKYSSYHVGPNTELIVKTDAGDVGRPATSTFMSSQHGTGKDNPKQPRELTPVQAARTVSFVFRNKKFFNMGFEISDASGGQNLLFGGKSSVLDSICPKRANRGR